MSGVPAHPTLQITGTRRDPEGAAQMVELLLAGSEGGLDAGPSTDSLTFSSISALDGDAGVIAVAGLGPEPAAMLFAGASLGPIPPISYDGPVGAPGAAEAFEPILYAFRSGLYGLERREWTGQAHFEPGLVRAPDSEPQWLCPPSAPEEGEPVAVRLSDAFAVVLGGLSAIRSGPSAVWLLSPRHSVSSGELGFEPVHADHGVREALERRPEHLISGARIRDALAAHAAAYPDAKLGPFASDKVEPAAQLARALVADVAETLGLEARPSVDRVAGEGATEFAAVLEIEGVRCELRVRSFEGRRLNEAVVRSERGGRATGVRPATRTVVRCLKELARGDL